jgi:hypothetical protein
MSFASQAAAALRSFVAWRRSGERRLYPEALVRVGFDDRGIFCSYPDGEFRVAPWSEIREVRIRTTSDGPLLPDVFWLVFAGEEAPRIIWPQGATGDAAMLGALQGRLPGLDNEQVLRAMCCAEDAVFVVWRR